MTQFAPMTALWHPAIRGDWLVLRRTGGVAFARMIGGPALLLVCCAAIACGDFYGGYGWCLAAGALLALGGSHAIAHERLLGAAERWRFGWCGALPVARGTTAGTLLLVATSASMVSVVLVTALLLGVSMPAPHRGDLPYALAAIDFGLVFGTASAAARVFRRGAIVRMHHADGIREPLLALPWLNDPRLPHLLDWQRRAALVRWRRGAGAATVALALFVIPTGASVLPGAGLVLLLVSLAWLDVALRACARATAEAARLLQPAPSGADRLRTASFRYPLLAAVCTSVLAVAGAIMISGGLAIAGLWGAAWVIVVSAWPLSRVAAARHSKPST